ncbi:MAG TPA: stalk domain-containing protein [Symbiobacteriaceae bacterium]|jgi:hypothetical protein
MMLWVLAAVFLFGSGTPVRADGGRPILSFLTVPSSVVAGQRVFIQASATTPDPQEGVCCGRIILQSPSGKQVLTVPLSRGASAQLEANFTMPAGAEGGLWKVARLELVGNSLAETRLEYGAGFRHEFTVVAATPDVNAPVLMKLGWSLPQVSEGAPVTLSADAIDAASGISSIFATVVPEMDAGEPLWSRSIRLVLKSGNTWEGVLLAPVMGMPTGRVKVSAVEVTDGSGNVTRLDEAKLTQLHLKPLSVVPTENPAGLNTMPYLQNVLHVGAISFLEWNRKDLAALDTRWDEMANDPEGVRSELIFDLQTLNLTIGQLRDEIYTDPLTGYKYVPLNTSGKWRALDKAMKARVFMLAELDRRAGTTTAPRLEKDDLLSAAYIATEPDSDLEPIDPDLYAEGGPALMAAVITTVARSSLPKGLMSAPHRAPDNDSISFLDRGLIWFEPFTRSGILAAHYDDQREIVLYLNRIATPQQVIHELFHELGHHFTDAFVGSLEDHGQGRAIWNEYMNLRGFQPWLDHAGWAGLPWENFAEDFAYTFLPDDLRPQYQVRQAFPRLDAHPDMLQAFRDWVGKRVAAGPEEPILSGNRGPLVTWIGPLFPGFQWQAGARSGCQIFDHPYDLKAPAPVDPAHVFPPGFQPLNGASQYFCGRDQNIRRSVQFEVFSLGHPGQSPHVRVVPVLSYPILLLAPISRVTDRDYVQIPAQTPLVQVKSAVVPGKVSGVQPPLGGTPAPQPPITVALEWETITVNGVVVPPAAYSTCVIAPGEKQCVWNTPGSTLSIGRDGQLTSSDPRAKLIPGENQLDFQVVITDHASSFLPPGGFPVPPQMTAGTYTLRGHVLYEPPDTIVPLTLNPPPLVTRGRVRITGSTMPYALVRANGQTTAADAYGHFALSITGLLGDLEKVHITAISPGGHKADTAVSLTYAREGTVTLDTPAVTNIPKLQVQGKAQSMLRVAVNGVEATIGNDGDFTAAVSLRSGTNQVVAVATDAAGNTARTARSVLLNTGLVPLMSTNPTTVWRGVAPPMTKVAFQDRPVPLAADGSYSILLPLERAGTHQFRLVFTPEKGAPYYHEVNVLRPVVVELPSFTNLTSLQVTGRAAPGLSLISRGQPVPVGPDGIFHTEGPTRSFMPFALEISRITAPWAKSLVSGPNPCFEQVSVQMAAGGVPAAVFCGSNYYPVPDAPQVSDQRFQGMTVFDWSDLPPAVKLPREISFPDRSSLPSDALIQHDVTLVELKGHLSGKFWIVSLPQVGAGTRFTVHGTSLTVTEGSRGGAEAIIPMVSGSNQVRFDYTDRDGQPAFMLFGVTVPAFVSARIELTIGSTYARVGGEERQLPVAPQVIDGTTYVPLRFIADALGVNQNYDPDTAAMALSTDRHVVILTVGAAEAMVDGTRIQLSAPARNVDGRIMVPLRFIAESLGFTVHWDPVNRLTTIDP